MKPTEPQQPETPKQEKPIKADQEPMEELLGSVTKFNTIDGSDSKSQQLRTSARVIKKMKLDSATSAATVVAPLTEKDKKEDCVVRFDNKKHLKPLWTAEDKNLFFEGLNEHGKDFEAICGYIINKTKRRGLPDSGIRSKDQIRHLYYKTWHKISKHLKFSPDIKKVAQELYGLVNYGELRKRMSCVNEKTCMKLNELIYTGNVAIRSKGKTVRVRTPMCRALRRLNELNDNHYDVKLPAQVTVEFRPKDMDTWLKVQEMAQNPRVKTVLPLQRRLSCLFPYLKEKWKSVNADGYEKLLSSANEVTTECLPDKPKLDEIKARLEPVLRLRPPPGVKIESPTVNLSEYFSISSICLNAYEERVGVKVPGEQLWTSVPWAAYRNKNAPPATKKHGGGGKRPRTDSTSAPKSSCEGEANGKSTDKNENCIEEQDLPPAVQEVIDEAVSTILALKELEKDGGGEEEEVEGKVNGDGVKDEKGEIKCEGRAYEVSRIREGWTEEDCGTFSIGELYLMFGNDSKLILEYSWDNTEPKIGEIKEEIPENQNVSVGSPATSVESEEDEFECKKQDYSSNVNLALKRLLSVAKLHYRKNLIKCPCGHVCGGNESNAKGKSSTPKVQQVKKDKKEATVNSKKEQVHVNYTPLRPLSPAVQKQNAEAVRAIKAQLESIQRMRPRSCGRRGRRPRSTVFVERKLPILANKGDLLQMNIISQDKLKILPPVVVQPQNKTDEPRLVETEIAVGYDLKLQPESTSEENGLNTPKRLDICDNAVMSVSRASSPTGISNFLELALGSQNQENILLHGMESKDSTGITFEGLLSDSNPSSTPMPSPSRLLKENENQWINAEVADFSLSSFLGHLESPMKAGSVTGDDSRMLQDVDAQLQSLLTENTVDYAEKFADLTAQVVSDSKK